MIDLTTECSFDLQAMLVIDVLGPFLTKMVKPSRRPVDWWKNHMFLLYIKRILAETSEEVACNLGLGRFGRVLWFPPHLQLASDDLAKMWQNKAGITWKDCTTM